MTVWGGWGGVGGGGRRRYHSVGKTLGDCGGRVETRTGQSTGHLLLMLVLTSVRYC